MLKRLITAFLIFLLTSSQGAASEQSQNGIIDKIENRFAAMRGFTANFRQTFYNASLDESEESSGTVAMQKPAKMRWDYESPERQLIIADGKSLYYYVPADKQVIVESLDKIMNSRSPALFLAGNKRLEELFSIRLVSPENKGRINSVEIRLEPKEKSLQVMRIILRTDAEDFTIVSFSLFDWLGNRTDIEFLDMKVNGDIDEKLFTFKRPKGVERIEAPTFGFGAE